MGQAAPGGALRQRKHVAIAQRLNVESSRDYHIAHPGVRRAAIPAGTAAWLITASAGNARNARAHDFRPLRLFARQAVLSASAQRRDAASLRDARGLCAVQGPRRGTAGGCRRACTCGREAAPPRAGSAQPGREREAAASACLCASGAELRRLRTRDSAAPRGGGDLSRLLLRNVGAVAAAPARQSGRGQPLAWAPAPIYLRAP